MNFLRNRIQRGALFLFVSVGFTRALFVTKEDTTLRFLYVLCIRMFCAIMYGLIRIGVPVLQNLYRL